MKRHCKSLSPSLAQRLSNTSQIKRLRNILISMQDNLVLKHHLSQVRKRNKTAQTNLRNKNLFLLIGRKTERIVRIKNESEQTLPISKRNLAENPAIKKIKEKFLLANIAGEPRVNNEEHIKLMHTTNVVTRIAIRLRRIISILTWARHQARKRITNPRVM
jgi:hypothetical protein